MFREFGSPESDRVYVFAFYVCINATLVHMFLLIRISLGKYLFVFP